MGKKILLAMVVVAVLAAGAVAILVLTRDDAPEAFSSDSKDETAQGTTPDSLEGEWTVDPDGSTVGFRIIEDIAGLTDHEAVGRTTEVSGAATIAGTEVTQAAITADLTALEFTDDPGLPVANRLSKLQDQGLEISQFPEASFRLTEPIDVGDDPTDGETVTTTATGELTLHGETSEITFSIDAQVQGARLRVNTTEPVPIVLADYGMTPPTGGPPGLSVEDHGTFELLLFFAQA